MGSSARRSARRSARWVLSPLPPTRGRGATAPVVPQRTPPLREGAAGSCGPGARVQGRRSLLLICAPGLRAAWGISTSRSQQAAGRAVPVQAEHWRPANRRKGSSAEAESPAALPHVQPSASAAPASPPTRGATLFLQPLAPCSPKMCSLEKLIFLDPHKARRLSLQH